ncbi:hypothetical protein DQX05_29205 [Paenibacillus thiaminolyticus]|uniref:Uncharacterized protein n=1 Tax=Paenibacillus thiaminolyticus TaxID=49283 RepID=A0A3A3GAM6_PANTH|nr:hypothetical protein DQX05_29205 [Paenibacillus thiaminolyticus]
MRIAPEDYIRNANRAGSSSMQNIKTQQAMLSDKACRAGFTFRDKYCAEELNFDGMSSYKLSTYQT